MPLGRRRGAGGGRAARPSISTRHRRQEPNGSRLSVAQSFGIEPPESGGGAHHGGAGRDGDFAAVDA